MVIIAPTSSANADWEGKREVEALVDVVDGVVVEEAVEEAMEKEQMGIRTKNSWRRAILDWSRMMKVASSKCLRA